MAAVYLGFDPHLERRVAIKVLLPDVAADSEIADRFGREAKLVAALNHPNVIPIYGLRHSATLSAIIMQFVEGNSLDVVLRERNPSTLPVPLAGLILSQVAAGLAHAHARGIVHRDVKPANVLLDPGGQAVVSDFGIARRYGGTSATGSGVLLGTASYMSPEQCLGRRAEAASDQYALGVMAFELFAGRRPFLGRTSDVLRAQISDAPPRLSELRPDLSPDVERFVMRMLQKDPSARHANLREVERFFHGLVPNESTATTQLKHVSLRRPMEASRSESAAGEPAVVIPPSRSRGRSLGLLAACIGVGALLAAGFLVLRRGSAGHERPVISSSSPSRKSEAMDNAVTSTAALGSQASPGPDRRVERSAATTAARPQHQSGEAPIGVAEPATTRMRDSVRADTVPLAIRPQGDVQPKVAVTQPPIPTVTASAADARAVASEFLTWCNHRQWRDVDRLSALDGSSELRSQLIDLIRKAPDFQAGFERLASQPTVSDGTFTTDFVLDLEWRGGQRQLAVVVRAQLSNGAWHLAGFGIHTPD